MENLKRPYAEVSIVLLLLSIFLFSCGNDKKQPAETNAVTTSANDNDTPTAEDLNLPENVQIGEKQVVAGEIRDYGNRDLKGEGEAKGRTERTSDFTGFAGVSPCDVIQPADLKDWPGGLGQVSSQRNNVGVIVLGCIYTFQPTSSSKGGRINVYFSDNQTPQQATESVRFMAGNGVAKPINDWDVEAAYDPNTGEFVWAKDQVFVTVQIEHPAVANDRERWTKHVATMINSRM